MIDVGEDEVHFRCIIPTISRPAPDDCSNDLQHRCDTRPTGDHSQMLYHIGRVDHCSFRTFNSDRVAYLQSCHVLGDITGGVGLEQKVEKAMVFIG